MAKAKQCKEEVVMGVTNKDEERPWEDIQGGLLQSISNLSLSDRIRFRLVCKGWKNIELPPRSIPLHIDFDSTCNSHQEYCPWFMFYHSDSEGECNFFHPLCNDTYRSHFPEIVGSVICHSKHGWLLMSQTKHCNTLFFFFHPVKRAIINLPVADFGQEYSIISFSSPPTEPDCVVFCTTEFWLRSEVHICYCRHGQGSWHSRRYEIDGPSFVPSLCNPVFQDGVFYCLGTDGRLGVFDPADRTWMIIPKLRGPNMSVYKSFIAECDGDLISVFFSKIGHSVCVFRLDQKLMKWVTLEDLGDRMMFVSHTTSMLLPALTKGTENKIYLPRFREEGNVYYSLFTGKYSIFDSMYTGENWYDTFEYMNSTWIDLSNGRTEDCNRNSHTDEELDWLSSPLEDDSDDDAI